MKALSVKQPWASAILDGPKDVENRVWPIRGPFPQWIGLHASAGWYGPKREAADLLDEIRALWPEAPEMAAYPTGALLGAVEVVGCIDLNAEACDSPWAIHQGEKSFAWVLGRRVRLPAPVPMRGALGLWTLPEVTVAKLRAAWGSP